MAQQSQSTLHRRLLQRYLAAVLSGGDQVVLHVNEIADICDYLDSKPVVNFRAPGPYLDDCPDSIIETFIKMKEQENGRIFGDLGDTNGAV